MLPSSVSSLVFVFLQKAGLLAANIEAELREQINPILNSHLHSDTIVTLRRHRRLIGAVRGLIHNALLRTGLHRGDSSEVRSVLLAAFGSSSSSPVLQRILS